MTPQLIVVNFIIYLFILLWNPMVQKLTDKIGRLVSRLLEWSITNISESIWKAPARRQVLPPSEWLHTFTGDRLTNEQPNRTSPLRKDLAGLVTVIHSLRSVCSKPI